MDDDVTGASAFSNDLHSPHPPHTMPAHTDRRSTARIVSPALRDLEQIISQPADPSPNCNEDRSVYQRIWQDDLTTGLSLAPSKLRTSVEQHMESLQQQIEKMSARVEHGMYLPTIGAEEDEEIKDELRGTIAQTMLERWSHEDAVEEITGWRPVPVSAVEERHGAVFSSDESLVRSGGVAGALMGDHAGAH